MIPNDYLYVTSRNIKIGKLDVSDADRISEEEHRKIYTRCDTKYGDLLLTKDGVNTGNAAINTVRQEVKLASGDYIDMKVYEPAMRHLLDTYIRAEESQKLSAFDDMTLVQMIVARGEAALDALPQGIRDNQEAMAETIENNVRKLIIDEMAVNPKYYERMSHLLDALIQTRKQAAMAYKDYLARRLT